MYTASIVIHQPIYQ